MSLGVEEIRDPGEFRRHRAAWQELQRRSPQREFYLDHRWLSAWFARFLGDDELRVLVLRDGDSWLAALPLVLRRSTRLGLPLRTLAFPLGLAAANLRGGLLAAADPLPAARALVGHLVRDAGSWERWQLDGLPADDPAFPALQTAIRERGLATSNWQLGLALYYLRPAGSFDSYLGERGRTFRKNLRLAANRLARDGGGEFTTATTAAELATALTALCELDARSSKAAKAGVIRLEGPVAAFYGDLVAAFGPSGECRIDLLKIAGQTVASLFALRSGDREILLYNAFDPAAAELAPGRQLFARRLASAWNELAEIDFNGCTPFVRTWSDAARAVVACSAFSPSLVGRLQRLRQQRLGPARVQAARRHRVCPLTPDPGAAAMPAPPVPALPAALADPATQFYADGRSALRHGLAALPLGAGDEIVFPAYHCGSELEVLLEHGLQLRYYPVPQSLVADPAAIAATLTPRTRAVYVIHYLGMAAAMAPIAALCRRHGLLLIEDCAQALYSAGPDGAVGSHGDLAIFSLHKFLPLADGGAARAPGRRLAPGRTPGRGASLRLGLRRLAESCGRHHGPLAATATLLAGVADALLARAGCGDPGGGAMSPAARRQLECIDHAAVVAARLRHQQRLQQLFSRYLAMTPCWTTAPPGFVPLLFAVWVEDPEPLLAALERLGIEAGRHWSAVDGRFPLAAFPLVAMFKAQLIVLPLHQQMHDDAFARIARALVDAGCRRRPSPSGDANPGEP